MDPVTAYALDVHTRHRVAGIPERLAAQRHLHDLAQSGQLDESLFERVDAHQIGERSRPLHDPNWEWVFDPVQALFVAVDWFASLRHFKGKPGIVGKPIVLIPTHVFEVGCIFGWVSKDKFIVRKNGRRVGLRRYQKAFITEARKNAKTTRLAGIGLYLMVGDMEASPEVYCAAVDTRQAHILYDASLAMAKASPDLRKRLKLGLYSMSHLERGGQFAPLSGSPENKDSFSPSGAFVDEYHKHPTSEIFDLFASAFGQRGQPLLATITTAGTSVESPCYHEYEYGKMILHDPSLNERYFVMIREMDETDNEHDPANWIKSNPLRASTPEDLAEIQQQHKEAFGSGNPAKVRTFRVKNLNRWVEGNESTYMGQHIERYDKLAVSRSEFLKLTNGALCLAGLDLAKRVDLTADGFVFLLRDGRIAVCAHGFLPEEALEAHEKTDRIPYRAWAKDGWMTVTDGAVTDYSYVDSHLDLCEKNNKWPIHMLCYDPHNASHFITEQQAKGRVCVEIRQVTGNLSEPTKLFRELVLQGKLVHDGSPLLRWCVLNAVEWADGNENIRISKKKAKDTKRVDLLVAIIDALREIGNLKEAVNYSDYVKSDEFGF